MEFQQEIIYSWSLLAFPCHPSGMCKCLGILKWAQYPGKPLQFLVEVTVVPNRVTWVQILSALERSAPPAWPGASPSGALPHSPVRPPPRPRHSPALAGILSEAEDFSHPKPGWRCFKSQISNYRSTLKRRAQSLTAYWNGEKRERRTNIGGETYQDLNKLSWHLTCTPSPHTQITCTCAEAGDFH